MSEAVATSLGNSALARVRAGDILDGTRLLEVAVCMDPPVGCSPGRAANLRTLFDLTRTPRSAALRKSAVAALARKFRIAAPSTPAAAIASGPAAGAGGR